MTEIEIRNRKIAESEELQELQQMLRDTNVEIAASFQKCMATLERIGIKKAQEVYGRRDEDHE